MRRLLSRTRRTPRLIPQRLQSVETQTSPPFVIGAGSSQTWFSSRWHVSRLYLGTQETFVSNCKRSNIAYRVSAESLDGIHFVPFGREPSFQGQDHHFSSSLQLSVPTAGEGLGDWQWPDHKLGDRLAHRFKERHCTSTTWTSTTGAEELIHHHSCKITQLSSSTTIQMSRQRGLIKARA